MAFVPDFSDWSVEILAFPSQCVRAKFYGFSTNFLLLHAGTRRSYTEKPYVFDFEKNTHYKLKLREDHWPIAASGSWIAGSVPDPEDEDRTQACAWKVGEEGKLTAKSLHQENWIESDVEAANAGGIFGSAIDVNRKESRAVLWKGPDLQAHLYGTEGQRSTLLGSDGRTHVGCFSPNRKTPKRAALWQEGSPEPVTLHPSGFHLSEASTVDGEYQFGHVQEPWEGSCARTRAARWQGSADRFTDITPSSFEQAAITSACPGYQAGYASKETEYIETTPEDAHAFLWGSHPETTLDLHTLLDASFIGSEAKFLVREDNHLRVYGQAWSVGDKGSIDSSVIIWKATTTG